MLVNPKVDFKSRSPAAQLIRLSAPALHRPGIRLPPRPPAWPRAVPSVQNPCSGGAGLRGPCPCPRERPSEPNLTGRSPPPGKRGCRFGVHAQDPSPLLTGLFEFPWAVLSPSVKGGVEMPLHPTSHPQGETSDSGLASQTRKRAVCSDWFGKDRWPKPGRESQPQVLLKPLGRRFSALALLTGYAPVRSCQSCCLRGPRLRRKPTQESRDGPGDSIHAVPSTGPPLDFSVAAANKLLFCYSCLRQVD